MSILYQPQYRVHGTSTWVNWGSPTANTSITIGANPPGPALSPLTQYDFQVVATNSVGSISLPAISATTPASGSVQTVALSPQTFTAGSAAGTLVGNVTVTLSSGTFNGTLTVTGTDASFFQSPITGGTLRLSGTTTTARTYNINIVATQSGLSNSPFSQNFPNISATSQTVTLTAPTQAANAGFNTLVFQDDFTSATPTVFSTITSTTQSGINWYCGNAGGVNQPRPTCWDWFPTTTAAQLTNGNSGGGSFASANGGIWEIKGVSQITFNQNWQSVSNSQNGPNAWKHMYVEAYIQFNINNSSPGGWPAWWSWPVNNSPGAEVDFMESGFTNQAPINGADNSAWAIHQPPGSTTVASGVMQHPVDSNWHVYGMLWKSTGVGVGSMDFYFDNVRVGGVTTGTGGTVTDMENATGQFLSLGTGVGIPIFVDWVRVWQ